MNRKFSTLLAGIALLSATSAFAGDNVTSLVEGTNSGLYQLKTGDSYLAVDADGKLSVVDAVEADNLASTLWCVTVTEENKGKAPYFDFVNKGAEALLSITMDEFAAGKTATTTAPGVGGEVSGWAFSATYETLEIEKPLYSYFTTDSVVGIVVDKGSVTLKKEVASKAAATFATAFTLVEADAVTLNATQINTKLGIQEAGDGVKLTFTPDANNTSMKNPFSQEVFLAEDVEAEDFVYITRKSDAKALLVDTSYINSTGTMFLAFNYLKDLETLKASDLEDHGKFLFTYFPTNDSLVIQVKTIIEAPVDGVDGDCWKYGTDVTINTNADKKNYVTVQDLVTGDKIRVVTIGEKKETDITLGYTSCKETDTDRVSLADGLYFIQNATSNKYMASPIHIDGDETNWVTVNDNEQNVNHMPAYQWVVLKTKTSDYFSATSPVSVTNREYPALEDVYQFTQAAGSSKYFCERLSADSLVITKITDPNVLGNKYLGYKYMTNDDLLISNYAFNYFSPYTMEKYIAQVAGSNKLNVLQETPTYFEIEPVGDNVAANYGYVVTANVKSRISGLAQLQRAAYTINTKNAYVGLGAESNFVITDEGGKSQFFFKENNEYNEKCYYAFVDAANVDEDDNSFLYKAGVADQSLTALLQRQVINEVRTSAFSIGLYDQPLYRRFDSALEGAVEGSEDATKVLKFKEYYRGEYLMDEANDKFRNDEAGVNYLGIWTKKDAVAGLSFYVDSAIITSTTQGYIKPQYFIYVSPEVKDATPAVPCDATNHQHRDANGNITDAEHCIHATPATPGFTKAKYLVSFQDSVDAKVANYGDLYQFGKYTRVGFVDALHIGDSLYVLTNGFEKVAIEKLDTAAIIAAYKAAGIEYNIIDLKAERTDDHHNYTWSFRYINPEAASAATEEGLDVAFLIESDGEKSIAPEEGVWMKSQNGCLVLSKGTTFSEAVLGGTGDNVLIFNVGIGSEDDMATDNEAVGVSKVSVIGGNGTITVKGAQGKTVVVSNVLGQTIANTVLTSDEATIAAPAGVVVVAVEGEEAVKAIVK